MQFKLIKYKPNCTEVQKSCSGDFQNKSEKKPTCNDKHFLSIPSSLPTNGLHENHQWGLEVGLLIIALTKRETERLKWFLRLTLTMKIKNHVPPCERKKTQKYTFKKNTVKLPIVVCTHPAIEGALEERLEVRGGKKKAAIEFSWHLINRQLLGESEGVQLGNRWGPISESPQAAATTITSVRVLGRACAS